MKIKIFILQMVVLMLFVTTTAFSVFSQKNENGLIIKFTRENDGHISTRNAVNEKVFNFIIEGISTQQQANDFINTFKGNKFVVYVRGLEVVENNNQRKVTIVMVSEAKIPNFQALLRNAGINYIYVDDNLISVDELESLKVKGSTKSDQ
ncbi:MAG: hypothetical protein WCQ95_13410 [Bacteroidota bacterium]